MTILFLFAALFVLMFIGVPVAVSLGLAGSVTIMLFSPDSVRSLAIKLFETSEHYTLLAIPFFLLSGAFMTTGGVARRLIDFANACVGHIRGGLAISAVLACMLFAALSGSSPATVAAVGSIAIAGMVRSGYPQAFGAGIVCNAGTLGILIPPSIVMVVYAAATEQSVGKLFMAGTDGGDLYSGAQNEPAGTAARQFAPTAQCGASGPVGSVADGDHSRRYLLGDVHAN
jgi:C4-dicarboxylate transporter DctM subunit